MNKQRRAEIARIRQRLEEANGVLEELWGDIEAVRDEEQESFDNLPESIQGSERGQKAEEAISSLDTAYDDLEQIRSQLDDLLETLDEAKA